MCLRTSPSFSWPCLPTNIGTHIHTLIERADTLEWAMLIKLHLSMWKGLLACMVIYSGVDIGSVEEFEFRCCSWFQTLPASPAPEKLCYCKIHTYLIKLSGNYKCGNMCYSGGWLAAETITSISESKFTGALKFTLQLKNKAVFLFRSELIYNKGITETLHSSVFLSR